MFRTKDGRTFAIWANPDQVAMAAEAHIRELYHEAVHKRGRFRMALAGGSTPERTYARLALPDQVDHFAWSRIDLFFGDERMVPHDDPRSNYGMATRSLLTHIPNATAYPIPTDARPADCAALYANTLATAFAIPPDGPPPRFDLILLGLGDDGHTASLFPGAASLNEDKAWVTWSAPGTLPPPVDRVTLTFPVLNAARAVLFLVAGANKAEAVRDVFAGADVSKRPASGVRPSDGSVLWLLDEAAASLLPKP